MMDRKKVCDVFPENAITQAESFVRLQFPKKKRERESIFKNCIAFECFMSRTCNRIFYYSKGQGHCQNFVYSLKQTIKAEDNHQYNEKTWKQLESRYQKYVHPDTDEYVRVAQKRESVTLGFRWSNLFLVKALFTFGLRTVGDDEYHLIQTHNIGMLYYEKINSRCPEPMRERSFSHPNWFRVYVIPPFSNFKIESGRQYILITYAMTLFVFERISNRVDVGLAHTLTADCLRPIESSDPTHFKTDATTADDTASTATTTTGTSTNSTAATTAAAASGGGSSGSPHRKRTNAEPLDHMVEWSSRRDAAAATTATLYYRTLQPSEIFCFDPFKAENFVVTHPETLENYYWTVTRVPPSSQQQQVVYMENFDKNLTQEIENVYNQAEITFSTPAVIDNNNHPILKKEVISNEETIQNNYNSSCCSMEELNPIIQPNETLKNKLPLEEEKKNDFYQNNIPSPDVDIFGEEFHIGDQSDLKTYTTLEDLDEILNISY